MPTLKILLVLDSKVSLRVGSAETCVQPVTSDSPLVVSKSKSKTTSVGRVGSTTGPVPSANSPFTEERPAVPSTKPASSAAFRAAAFWNSTARRALLNWLGPAALVSSEDQY